MTKILLVTDTHYGIRNDAIAFQEMQKKFALNYVLPKVQEYGIKQAIHLGDVYDRRKYTNNLTVYKSFEEFFDVLKPITTWDVIVGNHDCYYKNTNKVNTPSLFLRKDLRFIIHENTIDDPFCGEILLVPWINDENRQSTIEAIKRTKAEICFGHLELAGFDMHVGMPNENGMSADIFKKFDIVASGHFHHKSTKGNINYLGAHGEYTWADWNDPRGFHVFDTDTREFEFIENPYKMFNMIVYDDLNNKDQMQEYAEMDAEEFLKFKDTYVKIVVLNKTNQYTLDKIIDSIHSIGVLDLSIMEKDIDLPENEEESEPTMMVDETGKIIESYVDSMQFELDKEKMKRISNSIYMEAQAIDNI